ncbi:MAG: right-handed parallel beta-helix repeat-containing protein [Bacteroidales bacterium]|nr:right-handed parallel beta-helix repeat-containing protein [Bacteroidales bacterium]
MKHINVVLVACLAIFVSCKNDEMSIRDLGVIPDTGKDVTKAFDAALQECRKNGTRVLHLENGVYDFWPEDAVKKEIFVSNTSSEVECPSKIKVIGLLLEDQHNLTIEGNGAELRFHGRQTMMGIIHSSGIRLRNLHIDCERPGASEMLVERIDSDGIVLRFNQSSWYEITEEGRLELVGEGWKTEYPHCVEYDKSSGHMDYSTNWDIVHESRAEEIDKGLVKVFTGLTSSFKEGNILTVRDRIRDQVGILNLESEDLEFEDMGIHSLHAIGMVSQFCRNLSFRNVRFEPREGSGRILASSADFLHFSGCAGKINVQGCRFSGAQDDCINVHGTYLVLEEMVSEKQVRLRFAHHQTYGMQAFWPGDTISIVDRKSLRTVCGNVVDSVCRLSDREVLLTARQQIPREIVGGRYVIENLSWTPEVDISDNYFTGTNTRGTLITTPRKSVIRNNVYEKVGMSAIFISGDAGNWYESGAVKNLTITDNRFIDCAYNDGAKNAVILIEPSNTAEDAPVHDTIRIISNHFESEGRKPVVSHSVRALITDF